MAQHDYVIANGTGAAVRSDLNGGLAAIVSNNSGATEPGTMYAYQWWPDTTTGLLKIRNAANNAWVTVGTLASANLGLLPLAGGTMTGALAVTAGTAALPGIAVSGDLNTGIYSPGADQVAITTGGTQRLNADTAAVTSTLPVVHPLGAVGTPSLTFTGDLNTGFWSPTADTLAVSTAGSERARIDSSGRLLIGTSSARSNYYNLTSLSALLQIEGLDDTTRVCSFVHNTSNTSGPLLVLGKSRGTAAAANTLVLSGDELGTLSFQGADGSELVCAAQIKTEVDGTPGANDMPGRLVFSTTADGASSPTEQMRIDNAGNLKFNSGYGSVATAFGCRAWVNFDGTGTVAIRGSGNVSSITDNGVGDYTVNFTTAMVDANYAVTQSGQLSAFVNSDIGVLGPYRGSGAGALTTSSVRLSGGFTADAVGNTPVDILTASIAIFR